MRKIFIIGASSSIGHDIYNFFIKDKYKVIVTSRNNKKGKYNIKFKYFDLSKTRSKSYDNLIKNVKEKDLVIFLAAHTDKNWINLHYNKAKKLNFYQSILFLKRIKHINCKLVFLSSVEVFNGKTGNYSEKINPNPNSRYGKLKYSLEKFIQKNLKNYLIIRTGWIVSRYKFSEKCIIKKMYNELLNREALYAKDVYLNILSSLDLYKCIKNSINIKKNLLVHLSSDNKISRSHLALKIMKSSRKRKNMSYKITSHKNIKNKGIINKNNFLNTSYSKNLYKFKFNKIDQIVKSKIKLIEKLN